MMRILLVDDESLAIERLRVALAGISGTEIVGTAADGIEAEQKIAMLRPDLAILDIQMPGLSGIQVAEGLEEVARPDVVFVTAFNEFAIDAFCVDATDYLLKPVSFDRLRMAIDRVRRRRALGGIDRWSVKPSHEIAPSRDMEQDSARYDDGLWAPGRQGAIWVPVSTIDRIEAARDYILICTATKTYILRSRMNDIEQRLDPAVMLRIHRSHIVRIGAVIGIERPGKGMLRLLLSDGSNLQVGPNHQEQVRRALRL